MQSPAVHQSYCAALVRIIVAVGCIAAVGRAQTIYVDAAATGDADGTSWCDAFVHLQDALLAAETDGAHTIHVAGGTYRPDRGNGQTALDRAASFNLVLEFVVGTQQSIPFTDELWTQAFVGNDESTHVTAAIGPWVLDLFKAAGFGFAQSCGVEVLDGCIWTIS